MKKYYLFLLIFVCQSSFAITPELNKACDMVEDIFSNLKAISQNGESASKARLNLIKEDGNQYFALVTETPAPNEFAELGIAEANDYKVNIATTTHVTLFASLFSSQTSNKFTFDYKVDRDKSLELSVPEFKKGESSPEFAGIVVHKTYMCNGKTLLNLDDTLIVGLQLMKVTNWVNIYSKAHTNINPLYSIEVDKSNAALAYNSKKFIEAYRIYGSIIKRKPSDGESYYRMAIMLYKKDVDLKLSKKQRQQLILDYLDMAIDHGSYSIRTCAGNMKYWITC
ncbi:MAG: hypothetical protein LUC88_05325 [Prevotella sp.]|nr:hypothetical protein [Prevotella sp.]